jgi:hypothetical protein
LSLPITARQGVVAAVDPRGCAHGGEKSNDLKGAKESLLTSVAYISKS